MLRAGTPTIATPDNYNGQKALAFATGSANGCLLGTGGLPVSSDYSIVFVGHAPHSDSAQTLWSDQLDTNYTYFYQHPTGDKFGGQHAGATILQPIGATALSVTSPNVIVWSYKKTGKVGKFRLNGVEIQTGRTDSNEVTNGDLQLAMQGDRTTAHSPWTSGFIGEFMVFGTPLADAPNAALLANVEGYELDRYGLS
jgi:hypothetical protein